VSEKTPLDILVEDVTYIRGRVDKIHEDLDGRLRPLESFVAKIKGVLAVAVVIVPVLGAFVLAVLKGDVKWP
jgi:hypothetical protein